MLPQPCPNPDSFSTFDPNLALTQSLTLTLPLAHAACAAAAQLEATLQKSAFRMVGTVAGGVIGYCVMLKPQSATNPYALMAIACTIAFFSAFPANTQVSCRVFGRYHVARAACVLPFVRILPLLKCATERACARWGQPSPGLHGGCSPCILEPESLPLMQAL